MFTSAARALALLAACILAITACAASGIARAPLRQNWVKRGVILQPGFAGPRSAGFVSAPAVVRVANGRLRLYLWVADATPPWLRGQHLIIAAEGDPADPLHWAVVSQEPLIGPGPAGGVRDRGVGFPFVVPRSDGPWLMYYGTWGGDWTVKQELMNRTGVALSYDEGLTWQVAKEDMLPSGVPSSFDSGAIPSVDVLRIGAEDYVMWYTAAEKYLRFGEINQGILHIGAARSRDGLHWSKRKGPAMRAREGATEPYEACLARPAVLRIDGVYHMWLSVYEMAPGRRPNNSAASGAPPSAQGANRTGAGSYRIEYARSTDGVHWTRFADQPVLPLTPGGFDSSSQTYPGVVDMGEEIWLFYAGDGLGATGIGLATLKKTELQSP
jgi:hypothetical protein